jgi:DNA repair protein RadC
VAENLADIPHYHGHRERLRQRFRLAGADALLDYELLELILFRSIPRRDTKPLAKAILAKFGGFTQAIKASEASLAEIPGVGAVVIADLKVIHAVAYRQLEQSVRRRPLINSWDKALSYCRAAFGDEADDQLRVLLLDKRHKLIADEVLHVGSTRAAEVQPRQIVTRALMCSAMAILLVRWCPSSDPAASAADIKIAKQTIDIAGGLGIDVFDYIVIGHSGHISLRGTGRV